MFIDFHLFFIICL